MLGKNYRIALCLSVFTKPFEILNTVKNVSTVIISQTETFSSESCRGSNDIADVQASEPSQSGILDNSVLVNSVLKQHNTVTFQQTRKHVCK